VVVPAVLDVAESVASDHAPAVNAHAAPDLAAVEDRHVGGEHGIVADRDIIADEYTGVERHPRAQGDPVAEGDEGPDGRVRTDADVDPASDLLGDPRGLNGAVKN